MKNLLLFISSFLFFGLLVFACSGPSFAQMGILDNGTCYPVRWNCWTITPGSGFNNNKIAENALGWPYIDVSGEQGYMAGGTCNKYEVFYWKTPENQWYSHYGTYSARNLSTQEVASSIAYLQSLSPVNTHPDSYWPDGPPEDGLCGQDPPINCEDFTGNPYTGQFASDTGPFCWEGCELINPSGTAVGINGLYAMELQFTGEPGAEGCQEPPETREIDNCSEAQDYCEEICKGLNMSFSCDNDTGEFSCGCTYPPYHREYDPDSKEAKSDSDKDGLTNDDPSETDIDGDGTTDSQDTDPDGDGHTTQDKDSDNDGQNNRGSFTWEDQNADWGSHNGTGADPDIDGDGTPNGSDDDIDGDGILNGNDPDIDGDGVGNDADLDADGDGILDGADSDADGDGLTGGDDPDSDGSDASGGDTNGDGVVDGDDEPAPGEEWPTDEEIDQGYDDVQENTYDGNVEGDFTDPDLGATVQGYIDNHPFADNISGSSLNLNGADSCFQFPNPYTGGTEVYCLNQYESYWNAMGLIMLGLAGFLCFWIIKG